MLANDTSSQKPGILLGKIQSGKTRAFIGIMALAFDNGYDVSVILTKGTKALVKQTVQRMEKDFHNFVYDDIAEVFDIMHMPDNLTAYERNKKLIIVVKKEVNNMRKILEKLASVYPDLREKKILILDDEADFASVSFRKRDEAVEVGRISSQIDELRNIVNEVDYLQVTATPYSLYLQSNMDESQMEFLPKRPAFTVLVPIHDAYVGGDFYFEKSEKEHSVASYVYEEISTDERDVLKQPDARRLKLEDVLESDKVTVLRQAIVNFIVGGVIRRFQQKTNGERVKKYAFIAHSEIGRSSHRWQADLIKEIIKQFAEAVNGNKSLFEELISEAYKNLSKSINQNPEMILPSKEIVLDQVKTVLREEQLVTVIVNSDKDVEELLDNEGQLKLRNPLNIFVGGQILDRGVTINNLIGFYYGRSPKKFQQDTVLQHSRMYGARPKEDLVVTRFYTTRDIYEVMKRIHGFDAALRESFKSGGHDRSVYFIRKDVTGKLVPCSPNKLLLSSLVTLRPRGRMLPIGFQTKYKTHIEKIVQEIDGEVKSWRSGDGNMMILVDLKKVLGVIEKIEKTLELNSLYPLSWNTFKSSLEHLSVNSNNDSEKGEVWVNIGLDRNASREREFRFMNIPETATDVEKAREVAVDTPCVHLLRQNGLKDNGWRDTPFWWPVLVNPTNTEAAVFAEELI